MADVDIEGFELSSPTPVVPPPARRLAHTARTAAFIQPGQILDPHDWNATCPRASRSRLREPCVVQRVHRGARSQTGVKVDVSTVGGVVMAIDAAWFRPVPGSRS